MPRRPHQYGQRTDKLRRECACRHEGNNNYNDSLHHARVIFRFLMSFSNILLLFYRKITIIALWKSAWFVVALLRCVHLAGKATLALSECVCGRIYIFALRTANTMNLVVRIFIIIKCKTMSWWWTNQCERLRIHRCCKSHGNFSQRDYCKFIWRVCVFAFADSLATSCSTFQYIKLHWFCIQLIRWTQLQPNCRASLHPTTNSVLGRSLSVRAAWLT